MLRLQFVEVREPGDNKPSPGVSACTTRAEEGGVKRDAVSQRKRLIFAPGLGLDTCDPRPHPAAFLSAVFLFFGVGLRSLLRACRKSSCRPLGCLLAAQALLLCRELSTSQGLTASCRGACPLLRERGQTSDASSSMGNGNGNGYAFDLNGLNTNSSSS